MYDVNLTLARRIISHLYAIHAAIIYFYQNLHLRFYNKMK